VGRTARYIAGDGIGQWWEDRAFQRNFPGIANAAANPNSKSLFAPMIRGAGVGNENEGRGEVGAASSISLGEHEGQTRAFLVAARHYRTHLAAQPSE